MNLIIVKKKYNADNVIMIAASGVDDTAFKAAKNFDYDYQIMNLDNVIEYANKYNFKLTDDDIYKYCHKNHGMLYRQKEKVIDLYLQNKPVTEIKRILGLNCHVTSVHNFIKTLIRDGIIKKKISEIEENKDKIIELHNQGKSAIEIKNELNLHCNISTINELIRKLTEEGIINKKIPEVEKWKNKIIELHNQGKSAIEIKCELGLQCSIRYINKKIGIWKKENSDLEIRENTPIEKNKSKIIELYNEGKSSNEIACILELKCNPRSIDNAIIKWRKQTKTELSIKSETLKNKQEIIELYKQGKTGAEIKDILNLNCIINNIYSAIRSWISSGELKKYCRETKKELEQYKYQIIELHNQGATAQLIINRFNLKCTCRELCSELKKWIKQGVNLQPTHVKYIETAENINLSEYENWLKLSTKDFRFKIAELLKNQGYKISGAVEKNMFTAQRNGKTYIVKCINNKKPLCVGNLRSCAGYINNNNANLILITTTGIKHSKEIDEIIEQYKEKLIIYKL